MKSETINAIIICFIIIGINIGIGIVLFNQMSNSEKVTDCLNCNSHNYYAIKHFENITPIVLVIGFNLIMVIILTNIKYPKITKKNKENNL